MIIIVDFAFIIIQYTGNGRSLSMQHAVLYCFHTVCIIIIIIIFLIKLVFWIFHKQKMNILH